MNHTIQTILYFLQTNEGLNPQLLSTIRLAKKIASDMTIQHYVNKLESEIQYASKNAGIGAMSHAHLTRRNRNKGMKSKQKQYNNCSKYLPMKKVTFRIPNLMEGKSFKETIRALEPLNGSLELFNFKKDECLQDVVFNHSDCTIEGTIEKQGYYEIELYCFLLLPTGEKQRILGQLKISVIHNPRSLWKNLPSDPTTRFHKPDTVAKSCETDRVRQLAASVRGRSHAHKGTHRDDDINLYCSTNSEWNVLCVADGAGSCKYSRRGAELAVIQSTNTLKETLNGHYGVELEKVYNQLQSEPSEDKNRNMLEIYQHTMVKAVFDAARIIEEESKTEGDHFKDFSTTLLLAAYKPVKEGYLIMAFWVGDGGAVIYKKGESVQLLGEPDSGEYAGQTRFLDNKLFNDGDVYSRITIEKVPSMTALILATDGITDAKFETENQLSQIQPWDALWNELEPIIHNESLEAAEQELIKWMDFWSAGNHDDRSIAIGYIKETK